MSDVGPIIDVEHFQSYLSAHLDAHIAETELLDMRLDRIIRVGIPENPTEFVVRQPITARSGSRFVDAATEFQVQRQLESTDISASEAVHFCADDSVLGTPFPVNTSAPPPPTPVPGTPTATA